MLKLKRPEFLKFRSKLLRQKKEVLEDLKRLEKEDPVMDDEALPEAMESGEANWMADVHVKATAMKDSLTKMLKRTEKSLDDINKGKYGKCEKCGKKIEEARLEAMPTATLCISCSKKTSKS